MQEHVFCEPFFIRVILLKMKNKKTNDVNATTTTTTKNTLSRVLRQILMYLNHLWVCLVFYKVLAIFNLLYSIHKIRPITQSYRIIPFSDINQSISTNLILVKKDMIDETRWKYLTLSYRVMSSNIDFLNRQHCSHNSDLYW